MVQSGLKAGVVDVGRKTVRQIISVVIAEDLAQDFMIPDGAVGDAMVSITMGISFVIIVALTRMV